MPAESLVQTEPFVVSPKKCAWIEGCGLTEIYRRLNENEYESYTEGGRRFITMRSIRARQERLLAAASGTPSTKRSNRRGGPGHPKKRKPATSS
jgi:hypothetical protein